MGGEIKWLVSLNFHPKPRRTFYGVFVEEFGNEAEVKRVISNCYLVADDFTARRLRALIEWYGGDFIAFAVNGRTLDNTEGDQEARAFVQRIHAQRLSRRGRRSA